VHFLVYNVIINYRQVYRCSKLESRARSMFFSITARWRTSFMYAVQDGTYCGTNEEHNILSILAWIYSTNEIPLVLLN